MKEKEIQKQIQSPPLTAQLSRAALAAEMEVRHAGEACPDALRWTRRPFFFSTDSMN